MKLKDFCAILSLEKPDRTLLSEAWIGLLMFISVPFCIWLYYGGRSPTVCCRRTADILVGFIYIGTASRWEY